MRIIFARLAEPGHVLPMPDRGGRLFSIDGERIDADDPYWIGCLADVSVVECEAPVEAAAPVPTPVEPAPVETAKARAAKA
ncbi:hypothetical protein SAMN02745172_02465 [Pseudoxanthobacter soli DSM 19599]|uniref:DUF2635 domain-containing protein n=1 Tax=Pseudoxanthobacter soli DSM 19599 TaxID=1123029 RepID=A0A1M7ZLP2_9HYPH|nr:hypothetical protein [Pseudoxanthobacter soli]SHO65818.1 hypothetical protein SAMN02745172_02465 [Pseudoxanthobacter soli DSM 19599]